MSREIVETLAIWFHRSGHCDWDYGSDYVGKCKCESQARSLMPEIKRLLAQEREKYLKRLREERGLFALSLQMLAGRDFSAADKLATMRFASWEEVNGEAERARTLICQLDLTKDLAASSAEEGQRKRAEMFCNQCQGYVRVLAAPDHLEAHPEHTLQLRWYPPVRAAADNETG